jgi:hypothetical protein
MKLNKDLFQQALEMLVEDFDGCVTISDLGVVVNGTQIDHLMVAGTWDGDCTIKYYCGDYPLDEDGEYEEMDLTEEQINDVLQQFVDYM